MKSIGVYVVMMALLLPLNALAEKYALLVGIDAYPAPYTLDGCVQDVSRMEEVLMSKFGFPATQIKTVLDAQATLAGIESAFQTHLIQQARPGDVVVFYYSGHGTQTPDENSDEEDGIDETLCPVNALGTDDATWLTDDRLGAWLAQLRTHNVTVILDACFSGTATRMGERARLKTMDFGFYPTQRHAKVTFDRKELQHIVLAASSPEQTSWMLADQKGSVFTRFLTEVLVNVAADVTYDALMQDVIPRVQQYVSRYYNNADQTPQVEGNGQTPVFFNTDLNAPPAAATPDMAAANAQRHDFDLRLSTNKSEYRAGDRMTVTVQAAQDCYLRLYLVNAQQEITQLFPNAYQPDNFIRADQPVQIPGPGARFYLEMTPPFGTETLKAVASTVQFEDLRKVDWQGQTFLDFGKMPLAELNTRGVGIREIANVAISQAVTRYSVRQ